MTTTPDDNQTAIALLNATNEDDLRATLIDLLKENCPVGCELDWYTALSQLEECL